jgi:hypothetical protein
MAWFILVEKPKLTEDFKNLDRIVMSNLLILILFLWNKQCVHKRMAQK